MKIVLRAIRIYGSTSYYASPGPASDSTATLRFEKLKSMNARFVIHAGTVPDSALDAIRRRRAMSQVQIDLIHSLLTGGTMERNDYEARFREKLSSLPAHTFDSRYEWFFTLVIDQDYDIDDSTVNPGAFLWVDPRSLDTVASGFRSQAVKNLNFLAVYAATEMDSIFLEEVLIEDQIFVLAQDRDALPWPFFTAGGGTATASVGRAALDVNRLDVVLDAAASMSSQQHSWLEPISYWYLRALRERDPWKQFVWGFTTLEILCNKLWDTHYDNVLGNISFSAQGSATGASPGSAISKLVWPKDPGRVPLSAKFALLALALTPDTASADSDQFTAVKKVRDKITHGEIFPEDQLPRAQCRALLDRYIGLAAERSLGLGPSELVN